MIRAALFSTGLFLVAAVDAADYVGGEADTSTPQVRLVEPGRYRMCAVLQTDAHVLRVMAGPRHFPSIDCKIVRVTE